MTVILSRSGVADALMLVPTPGDAPERAILGPGDRWADARESTAPRLRAWALALAAHALVGAVLLRALAPAALDTSPPLVRLVFVEPPPPPAGEPAGAPAEVPAPAVATPPAEPTRPLPVPRPRVPPRRAPERPAPVRRPPPAVADTSPRTAAQAPAGEPTGVAGSSPGGIPGGVVGGRGEAPVPVDHVAQPPQVVSRVAPEYPDAARRRGVEGLVLLEAVLDAEGRVAPDITVLRSVPDLDAAAVAALRRWRFRPARDEGGRAVPVILEVPIRFVLR